MNLLAGFICSHNIVQRISSVPWHLTSLPGGGVGFYQAELSIKQERDAARRKPDYFTLFPELTSQHCSTFSLLEVGLYVHVTLSGKVNTQSNENQELGHWSFSDTAHHTILILYKDFVLQTVQDSGLVHLLSSISPNSSYHHDLNKNFLDTN